VQELASAFNEMNARLQASQQSQRDFVANVSRSKTPLTSIQGFAQALLDGTASSPQQIHSLPRSFSMRPPYAPPGIELAGAG
jgi:signal transduction histidine kinase